ncbi:unnamed protein product [Caenorhabditis bovis]|uniref:CAF1B/HIR1 beta-propeller domain-containing protein n=1 Tax=Caenorhabditis bovis TaxID=2654633 RepID=A0A8S1F7W7_9PELO|nr:unnamed protein product [Caenorhabditis bovis]
MPQIFWHDRKALLSVDVHKISTNNKYKIVTSSVQKEVRIWEFEFENDLKLAVAPLSVSFIANLTGHNTAINQVKFSPSTEHNLLASGDCHGRITIWQISDSPPPPPQDELPPNKENWVRFKILNHDSDVSAICWSPDGTQLASVSNDDCLCMHQALTGVRQFVIRNFRHFPNGICWDPLGKYIITMSADRKMDIVDAVKGTRLKYFSTAELPMRHLRMNEEITLEPKLYKLFHDDQLFSFQRGVTFSPNAEVVAAPCAHLELGSHDVFGTYIFKREDLARERPSAFYPCERPTFLVRFSPLILDLLETSTNVLGLPYRLIWAALTKDSVLFYDSQHESPIGIVSNMHYNALSDASWSSDGQVLVLSSLEGYCSFIKFKVDAWGTVTTRPIPVPTSPQLIEDKKRKKKAPVVTSVAEELSAQKKSPIRPVATTPKNNITPLTKFFKSGKAKDTTLGKEAVKEDTPKVKKRVQLITLTD